MQIISIIIPVYNTEKYLDRCIQSVLAQTYANWELLLIDDGSTDSSGVICDKYAELDNRIRVFHKKNNGVSAARNLGLDSAQGEWITFIDADDFVKPKYLDNLLSHIASGADLVFSYAEFQYADGRTQKEVYSERLIVCENFYMAFTEHDLNWHTSPWSKLYKAERCSTLRFTSNMPIGEDLVFLYSYLLECESVFFSSDADYCYRVDTQSSLTKKTHKLEVEYFVYNKVVSALDKLIKAKNITDARATLKSNWIVASYTRRVLNALYADVEIGRVERIAYIKNLCVKTYTKHIGEVSIQEKITIFLLKKKMYGVYDIVRYMVSRVKNVLNLNYA